MNASGILNFLGYEISPFTGSDNVFNKFDGETFDVIQKQIIEMFNVKNSGWTIYNSLEDINFEPNGDIIQIAKKMKQKSILVEAIASSTAISDLPRDNGILLVIKVSHQRTAFIMATPIGVYYTYINYNEAPYIGWLQLNFSKDNQLINKSNITVPNYTGVKSSSLHMVNSSNTVVLSGSFTLNNELPGNGDLTVVTNLPTMKTPKQTLQIILPYVISGSTIIPIRLEINTSGQIILHNLSSTSIPAGYSIPVALTYVTHDVTING